MEINGCANRVIGWGQRTSIGQFRSRLSGLQIGCNRLGLIGVQRMRDGGHNGCVAASTVLENLDLAPQILLMLPCEARKSAGPLRLRAVA